MSDTPGTMPAIHHVAYACQDLDATHHFYHDIVGFELTHTELTPFDKGYFRHVFYDCGDGSALAFFDLHGVGEPEPIRTAISTDLGLPAWVNHFAYRVDEDRKAAILERLRADGREPDIELDHGWCISTYITDPNGILFELCLDHPGLPADPVEAERLRHEVPAGM